MRLTEFAAATALAAALGTGAMAASVTDAFVLEFGANSTSSNTPATGAAGTATFSFTDEGGDVRVAVGVANTTGDATFGAGATTSKLTGFGFDLLAGDSANGGFTSGGFLVSFLLDAANPPDGSLDVAFADNTNFVGGNANGALPEGQSTIVTFLLDTMGDAMTTAARYETAFFGGGLEAGLRFQQVNAGAGSDKLGFVPPVEPPVAAIPLPAGGILLLGAMGAMVAMRRRA